jgi:GxxExxY protein
MMADGFPLGEETYRVLGACFEVYNVMGCGFLEPVYQECLEIEFRIRGIQFEAQKPLNLEYKGRPLQREYRPDFICDERVVVEIKAASRLSAEHRSQLLNYLHASGLEVGLLVNFGHFPKLEYERFLSRNRLDTRVTNSRSSDESMELQDRQPARALNVNTDADDDSRHE